MEDNTKKTLEKQGYRVHGHCAIEVCNWTKKSLRNEGFCYKQKFYGIKSHRCCQMSPAVMNCENQCLHCWRPIELTEGMKIKGEILKPKEVIDSCIEMHKKMLAGFKGEDKAGKRYYEAINPSQFAISLSGEPTIYPYLGEMIEELRKRKITSFLVTNGLHPEVLEKLSRKKQLPTQLYLSVNASNEELFNKIVRSRMKNAWKVYLKTVKLFSRLKTRRVFRFTLVKELNMNNEDEYAELIKLGKPDFVEVKGFMSVGFARQRLGYERMPFHHEVKDFAKKIAKLTGLKVLDEKTESRVVLLGHDKRKMKIKMP